MKARKIAGNTAVYALYALTFLTFAIPIYWAFVTSIKQPTELFANPPMWFTFHPTAEHYATVIRQSKLVQGFTNSLILSAATTGITTVLATLAAYGFSRYEFRGKKSVLNVLLVSRMLPAAILMIPLYAMLNALKILNTRQGLIFVYTSINIPFSVWILKTFFDSIPRSLDEAAMIDGCNMWQVFWRVIMPLVKPGIVASAVLAFFSCWNEFLLALVLTSTNDVQPLSIVLRGLMSEQGVKWGMMMAGGCLAILPPALFFIAFQKHFIVGITGGAVKG